MQSRAVASAGHGHGMAWHGLAWAGMAQHGTACEDETTTTPERPTLAPGIGSSIRTVRVFHGTRSFHHQGIP